MAKRASSTVSEELFHDYDDRHLECRGLMHAWRHIGYFRDGAYISRALQCTRCYCKKVQTMSRNGDFVKSPSYKHPDGYLLPGSGGNVPQREARKEALRRNGPVANSLEDLFEAAQTKRGR